MISIFPVQRRNGAGVSGTSQIEGSSLIPLLGNDSVAAAALPEEGSAGF